MTAIQISIALLLGATTWSLAEYCIHRWLGHDQRFRPNPFAKEHIRHHIEGDYFAANWKKAASALVIFGLVLGPSILIAGLVPGVAYCAGFVGFYLFYEILHRLEHVTGGIGFYVRWARRHHFYHHFVDARFNHGVTSPIWDLVFGTYRTQEKIAVPRRLMMSWLGDLDSGIRPEYASRYELKTKRQKQDSNPAQQEAALRAVGWKRASACRQPGRRSK